MDADFCQKIKCGIIPQSSVSMEDLYACSAEYGAGVLFPCHVDCKQYGKCPAPPVALPLPLMAVPTTVALQTVTPENPYHPPAITIEKLIQPVPDIVALQVPLVTSAGECDGTWNQMNEFINNSPVCALVLLGIGLLTYSAVKGGK
jgi:hypothetical protein